MESRLNKIEKKIKAISDQLVILKALGEFRDLNATKYNDKLQKIREDCEINTQMIEKMICAAQDEYNNASTIFVRQTEKNESKFNKIMKRLEEDKQQLKEYNQQFEKIKTWLQNIALEQNLDGITESSPLLKNNNILLKNDTDLTGNQSSETISSSSERDVAHV